MKSNGLNARIVLVSFKWHINYTASALFRNNIVDPNGAFQDIFFTRRIVRFRESVAQVVESIFSGSQRYNSS